MNIEHFCMDGDLCHFYLYFEARNMSTFVTVNLREYYKHLLEEIL